MIEQFLFSLYAINARIPRRVEFLSTWVSTYHQWFERAYTRTNVRTCSICLAWPVWLIPLIWTRGNHSFVSQYRSYSSCSESPILVAFTPTFLLVWHCDVYFLFGTNVISKLVICHQMVSPPLLKIIPSYHPLRFPRPILISFFLSNHCSFLEHSWPKTTRRSKNSGEKKESCRRLFKIAKWNRLKISSLSIN